MAGYRNPSKNWVHEYIAPDGTRYNMDNVADRNYVFENIVLTGFDEDFANYIINSGLGRSKQYRDWLNEREAYAQAQQSGDWLDYQHTIANQGVDLSPEQEKYMDNMIASQNAQIDRDYQTQMRDSSLTSAGQQLQTLGLSPSGVIQVGGASSGVSSSAPANNMHSAYQTRQQARINDFNQKMGLAKSLISSASSMASSGIYGHAISAVRSAGAKLATATAHSGLNALKSFGSNGPKPTPGWSKKDEESWNAIMKDLGY